MQEPLSVQMRQLADDLAAHEAAHGQAAAHPGPEAAFQFNWSKWLPLIITVLQQILTQQTGGPK